MSHDSPKDPTPTTQWAMIVQRIFHQLQNVSLLAWFMILYFLTIKERFKRIWKLKKTPRKFLVTTKCFFPPVEDSEVFKYATGFWVKTVFQLFYLIIFFKPFLNVCIICINFLGVFSIYSVYCSSKRPPPSVPHSSRFPFF